MGYDMQGVRDVEGDLYFRINTWCMGVMVWILDGLGVIDWRTPMPNLPPSLHGWNEPDRDDPRRLDFQRWYTAATGVRSKEPGKVPVFKFMSNDGWHITPAECVVLAEALHRCDTYTLIKAMAQPVEVPLLNAILKGAAEVFGEVKIQGQDTPLAVWAGKVRAFAEFCERCVAAGGFRVM